MLRMSGVLRPLLQPSRAARAFSAGAGLQSPRKLAQLKKLQAEFQCEDGRPIYLKRGLMDRVLYSSTLVLCVVGILDCLLFFYDQAKPSSWKAA